MKISNCIDETFTGNLRTTHGSNLSATTLEEVELIDSIAKLLYKTKSVRKTISILDSISNMDYKYLLNDHVYINEHLDFTDINKHEQIPYSGC